MSKIIETTVYTFDELSESAKDKARDWYRSVMENNDFAEFVIEDAARMADMIGINLRSRTVRLMGGGTRQEPEVYWSGFSHQGQGACFVGSYAYKRGSVRTIATEAPEEHDGKIQASNAKLNKLTRELADLQRRHFYRLSARVSHTGRGEHEYSTTIDVFNGDNDADKETAEALGDLLRDFMLWIYRGLETEYDYQNSDAVVDETIRANDYTFDENGQREG